MLKPYTRNKRQIDKIIDKCIPYSKHILETILKDKDTLYSIEELPRNLPKQLLSRITGVDNVCILMYDDANKTNIIYSITVLDKDNGYSIREKGESSILLYRHLVGLRAYTLVGREKRYIIKTNYTSVDELITKFGIEVVDI